MKTAWRHIPRWPYNKRLCRTGGSGSLSVSGHRWHVRPFRNRCGVWAKGNSILYALWNRCPACKAAYPRGVVQSRRPLSIKNAVSIRAFHFCFEIGYAIIALSLQVSVQKTKSGLYARESGYPYKRDGENGERRSCARMSCEKYALSRIIYLIATLRSRQTSLVI